MDPLAPGDPQQVGRYRLGGRLGAGGMGEVFWGLSPSGRAVAVKLVRRELGRDIEFRRRFAQEVEAAKRVSGFHAAPVVDADPDGEPPWLVTAYVPGPSLSTVLHHHRALPEHSLHILAVGLAEALEAIHRAGVIHRDLKPANILLAHDGPRVIDFGTLCARNRAGSPERPALLHVQRRNGGALKDTTVDHISVVFASALEERCSSSTSWVELRRLELLTPSMPWRCATNCAIAPGHRSESSRCGARRAYNLPSRFA